MELREELVERIRVKVGDKWVYVRSWDCYSTLSIYGVLDVGREYGWCYERDTNRSKRVQILRQGSEWEDIPDIKEWVRYVEVDLGWMLGGKSRGLGVKIEDKEYRIEEYIEIGEWDRYSWYVMIDGEPGGELLVKDRESYIQMMEVSRVGRNVVRLGRCDLSQLELGDLYRFEYLCCIPAEKICLRREQIPLEVPDTIGKKVKGKVNGVSVSLVQVDKGLYRSEVRLKGEWRELTRYIEIKE